MWMSWFCLYDLTGRTLVPLRPVNSIWLGAWPNQCDLLVWVMWTILMQERSWGCSWHKILIYTSNNNVGDLSRSFPPKPQSYWWETIRFSGECDTSLLQYYSVRWELLYRASEVEHSAAVWYLRRHSVGTFGIQIHPRCLFVGRSPNFFFVISRK